MSTVVFNKKLSSNFYLMKVNKTLNKVDYVLITWQLKNLTHSFKQFMINFQPLMNLFKQVFNPKMLHAIV